MNQIKEWIKTYFAAGLLVIVPLIVTVWLVTNLVTWMDSVFAIQQWSPIFVPGFGLILAFLVILLAGVIGKNVFGNWIVSAMSVLLKRIPVVGSVYSGLRQTMESLMSGGEKFGRAVLVEYPRAGSWTVALVTNDKTPDPLKKQLGPDMMAVFVPTTPNPTSGFLLIVPKDQVRPLNIRVEEALKLIVSLGLVEGDSRHGD